MQAVSLLFLSPLSSQLWLRVMSHSFLASCLLSSSSLLALSMSPTISIVVLVRPRSHYGRNDGDGMVTFYRSHYTFRNTNVNVALTWRQRQRDNGCHRDVNVDVTMDFTATFMATVVVGVFSDLRNQRSERWRPRARNLERGGILTLKES